MPAGEYGVLDEGAGRVWYAHTEIARKTPRVKVCKILAPEFMRMPLLGSGMHQTVARELDKTNADQQYNFS